METVLKQQNTFFMFGDNTKAGAYSSKSLVIFDFDKGIAIEGLKCEEGHALERSLLPGDDSTIEPNDLLVADRNFCVRGFLFGIAR